MREAKHSKAVRSGNRQVPIASHRAYHGLELPPKRLGTRERDLDALALNEVLHLSRPHHGCVSGAPYECELLAQIVPQEHAALAGHRQLTHLDRRHPIRFDGRDHAVIKAQDRARHVLVSRVEGPVKLRMDTGHGYTVKVRDGVQVMGREVHDHTGIADARREWTEAAGSEAIQSTEMSGVDELAERNDHRVESFDVTDADTRTGYLGCAQQRGTIVHCSRKRLLDEQAGVAPHERLGDGAMRARGDRDNDEIRGRSCNKVVQYGPAGTCHALAGVRVAVVYPKEADARQLRENARVIATHDAETDDRSSKGHGRSMRTIQ